MESIEKMADAIGSTIGSALDWSVNVPAAERYDYRRKLIDVRRKLRKFRFAAGEKCSAATIGESQVGKSYLVSALLSSPEQPFKVTIDNGSGVKSYDFISQINPSSPGSSVEATGVITRFTARQSESVPRGYLRLELLSVVDIVLILCEAFYNHVDYSHEDVLSAEKIDEILRSVSPGRGGQSLLKEEDVLDIEEYIRTTQLQKKCTSVLDSCFFKFLLDSVGGMSDDQIEDIIPLLWHRDQNITRLWEDLLKSYSQLDYKTNVYVDFEAVLRDKGTLIDVARLDEMYGKPETVGVQYKPNASVLKENGGTAVEVNKAFLSALTAELTFELPKEIAEEHQFLKNLDILDFPGARHNEDIKQSKLHEGKNLSTVFRRGKVSYLFNKYSLARRISTIMLCHNNNQAAESTIGSLIDSWVRNNIGKTGVERDEYVRNSQVPPLFIIATWFNKDLEYQDETPSDMERLRERWRRRFNVVLSKEILKSVGDKEHWFNSWGTKGEAFKNIFLLRDFKYSRMIFNGYDPNEGKPEEGEPIAPSHYPDFYSDLKKSFVEDEFVCTHFDTPSVSWNEAATSAHDGTKAIIRALERISPNVAKARDDKFSADLGAVRKSLLDLLENYYHPEDSDERVRLAQRRAGDVSLGLNALVGEEPYAFGRLVEALGISEADIYEYVHEHTRGVNAPRAFSNVESQVFEAAGLSTSASKEENEKALVGYLGVQDIGEATEMLKAKGIDVDKLLSVDRMVDSIGAQLVEGVVKMWYEKKLAGLSVNLFAEKFPMISAMNSTLWTLFCSSKIKQKLVDKVDDYRIQYGEDYSVGIIADYLSRQINDFASAFGFFTLPEETTASLKKKSSKLSLRLDFKTAEGRGEDDGAADNRSMADRLQEFLGGITEVHQIQSRQGFGSKERDLLRRYSTYGQPAAFIERMRIAFLAVAGVPDYDVEANRRMKSILDGIASNGSHSA